MVNPAYKSNEFKYVLTQVKAKGIITDQHFKTQDYPKLLMEAVPGMLRAPHGQPLNCPELPELSFIIVATEEKLPGCYRLKDVMNITKCTDELYTIEEQIQPDDPAFIQFSSGTTGLPKGAILSHFGTINNCHYLGKRFGYDKKPSSVLCLQVPLFHIFGSVLGIMSGLDFGITLYLPGPIFKKDMTEIIQTS
ncbi:medium-chain acyl-CoA ligase ACSF2, mitochondrial-like, partial [Halyomorpha halys]